MAKFNVNDNVIVVATNQKGVVVSREEVTDKETKRTNVTYMVKLGAGFDNYKVFKRKDLQRVPKAIEPESKEVLRVYDAPNGVKVTMVGVTNVVENEKVEWEDDFPMLVRRKEKVFRLGVSFYNPVDEYDEKHGYKIARHRANTKPFCSLSARFLGEFNAYTVEALMDAKARYIIENIDKFVNN